MGIYVNPDNVEFYRTLASKIYVDKSFLISKMNELLDTDDCYVCVSRPRRFGKSMAANMLTAYYSCGCNSREMFENLKAAHEDDHLSKVNKAAELKRLKEYSTNLNQHNVIRFDVQQFLFNEMHLNNFTDKIQEAVIEELKEEFGDCFEVNQYGLQKVLNQIYKKTKKGFIFIIDEWDCVFRLAKDNKDCQQKYLSFLRGLFKGAKYVKLAYMTGILPIKKYGEHSAINIFDEYSMTDSKDFGEYFGFTEQEVKEQCLKHNVDFNEMKKWYDGYMLGRTHIYNPKSVVDVLKWKKYKSYWTGTETYEALKLYIEQNFDGLKEAVIEMLGGGHCRINTQKFQNDMTTLKSRDDVLTLLIHLGYLTYDDESCKVFIPNQEIIQEFLNAVEEPGWDGLIKSLRSSIELLNNTWKRNGEAVANSIDMIHNETALIMTGIQKNMSV